MPEMKYTVHSVVQEQAPVEMQIDGRTTIVTQTAIVVELVEANHGHTFRLRPKDAEIPDLLALFKPGNVVTVTFSEGA